MSNVKIDPLVSCQWLKDKIDKGLPDDIVICDVSWGSTTDMKKQYESCHIPGAVYVKIMDEAEFSDLYPRNIPKVETFQQTVMEAGINKSDHLILYSDSDMNSFFISGRGWLTFKMFGHEKVSILDGGLKKWKNEGFALSTDTPKRKLGNFTASKTEKYVKNFDEMKQIVKDGKLQICDGRPPSKFSGAESTGHIKGARNLPLPSLVDTEHGILKSTVDLKKAFAAAKIDLTKPVIYYCISGMSSCGLAFISQLLGCKDASVYMAGFTEWGKRAPNELIEQ